jgi:hypothetical protein
MSAGAAGSPTEWVVTHNGHELDCLCAECCFGDSDSSDSDGERPQQEHPRTVEASSNDGGVQGADKQPDPPSPHECASQDEMGDTKKTVHGLVLSTPSKQKSKRSATAELKKVGAAGHLPDCLQGAFYDKESCDVAKDDYLYSINKSAVQVKKESNGFRKTWRCPTFLRECSSECKAAQVELLQHDTQCCSETSCQKCKLLLTERKKRKTRHDFCQKGCPLVQCPWFLQYTQHRSKNLDERHWYFLEKTFNPDHLESCMTTFSPSAKQVAKSEVFQNAFKQGPSKRKRHDEIWNDVADQEKYNISKDKMRHAKNEKRKLETSFTEGVRKLQSFCDEFKVLNPGSIAEVQAFEEDNSFRRMVVVPGCMPKILKMCCKVFAIDGCTIKHEEMEDWVILTLTTRTGDGRNMPVAFAIVPVEDEANCSWFLEKISPLLRDSINSSDVTVISDRKKGLLNACETWSNKKIQFRLACGSWKFWTMFSAWLTGGATRLGKCQTL